MVKFLHSHQHLSSLFLVCLFISSLIHLVKQCLSVKPYFRVISFSFYLWLITLSIFLCAYLPSTCSSQWNVCSCIFPISHLDILFAVNFWELFSWSRYKPLSCVVWKYFFPVCRLSLHPLYRGFVNFLIFMMSRLSFFPFCLFGYGTYSNCLITNS